MIRNTSKRVKRNGTSHTINQPNEITLALIILEDKIEYLRHLYRIGEVMIEVRAGRKFPRWRYNSGASAREAGMLGAIRRWTMAISALQLVRDRKAHGIVAALASFAVEAPMFGAKAEYTDSTQYRRKIRGACPQRLELREVGKIAVG
jgi:hypothetical protein